MKNNKLISIIIPCYNQAQYLEEAVQSALDQTYPSVEIIIVNDGSSDNTQEVALELQKNHPEKIQIISQKNSGVSEARNNAIKQALGTYILPLDGDDKLDKEMLSKCMITLEKYKADIVYVGYKRFGITETSNSLKSFPDSNPLYVTPCSVTTLFKKKIWEKIGGYKKNMSDGYEDWEFWINAYKHGYKFQHHPEILFYYRVKEESRFTNTFKKEEYLQSKIVMNHPELYTKYQVQKSIAKIKEVDELSDFYFYAKGIPDYREDLLTTLSNYLSTNTLQDQQILSLVDRNKKVELFSLDTLNNIGQLEQLHKGENINLLLFFAPMRYQVPSLKNCDFAWKHGKGMIAAEGSIFTYVFKDKREDLYSQFIAYQRLERYDERKKTILNGLIKRQERTFKEQLGAANQKYKVATARITELKEQLGAANKKSHNMMEQLSKSNQERNNIIAENTLLEKELTQAHQQLHLIYASASYRLGHTLIHEKKTLANPKALWRKFKTVTKMGDRTRELIADVTNSTSNDSEHSDYSEYKTGKQVTTQTKEAVSSSNNKFQHPLYTQIHDLNLNMYKYTNKETEYAIEMLDLTIRSESYDRAFGLIKYLLHYYDTLNKKQKEYVLSKIVPIYLAHGKKEELKDIIVSKCTELPSIDIIVSSFDLLFSKNSLNDLNSSMILPSGKLNILKLNNIIKYNDVGEFEFIEFIYNNASLFLMDSQLYGTVWNYYLDKNKKQALVYINKILKYYSLPLLLDYKVDSNILNDVQFENKCDIDIGPLVSIIVSAYNAADNIDYVIKSLVHQTYKNIEILICDDLSKDTTVEKLKTLQLKYSKNKIKIFQSKQNQGTYNIRNELIDVAQGELITFQDSDDYSLPTRIEEQVKSLTESNAVACISQWIRIRPNGEIVYFLDQNAIRMSAVSIMAPRHIFIQNGKYEAVKFGADTHFHEKLREKYGDSQIVHMDAPLLLGLWSGQSLTRTKGIEALEDGYRGKTRRDYARFAFEKRFYGEDIFNDDITKEELKKISVHKENHGIVPIN